MDSKKNKKITAINKLNEQLSRVKLNVDKNDNISLRGQFPDGMGGTKRRRFGLGCKNTIQGRKFALGKAKEIESQLLLGTWGDSQKEKLTVFKAIQEYEKYYWSTNEKTENRAYNWRKNQQTYWSKLPQDKVFNASFLTEVLSLMKGGSYQQKKMATLLSPVAKHHNIDFDFKPYKRYKQKSNPLKNIPSEKTVISTFGKMRYDYHNLSIVLLAYFGLRPHELFRSFLIYDTSEKIVKIEVGSDTKKQIERTAYPIPFSDEKFDRLYKLKSFFKEDLDSYNLRDYYNQFINIDLPNKAVGGKVSHWFKNCSFSPYQLRHYYAVRGALQQIHVSFMCKWMGHSMEIHYKHYGSLLDDRHSDEFWKTRFKKNN